MDYPEKILTISIAAYNVQQYLDKLLASRLWLQRCWMTWKSW